MTSDRVGTDEFLLTQEFLAAMLGVRRPAVTVAAGMLHQAGLIRYRRGLVSIVDRERLEQSACEDYRLTRKIYERMYRGVRAEVLSRPANNGEVLNPRATRV